MKNLLIMIVLFISTIAKADIAPPRIQYPIYTEISNLNDYNDTIFLSCNFVYAPSEYKQLAENEVIEHDRWHYNNRWIMAIPKNIFDGNNTFNIIDHNHEIYGFDYLNKISVKIKLYQDNDLKGKGRDYPISNESRFYKITSITDDNVTLKLSKRVIKFDDGTQKTITY